MGGFMYERLKPKGEKRRALVRLGALYEKIAKSKRSVIDSIYLTGYIRIHESQIQVDTDGMVHIKLLIFPSDWDRKRTKHLKIDYEIFAVGEGNVTERSALNQARKGSNENPKKPLTRAQRLKIAVGGKAPKAFSWKQRNAHWRQNLPTTSPTTTSPCGKSGQSGQGGVGPTSARGSSEAASPESS